MTAALSSITGQIGRIVRASSLTALDAFIGSDQFITLLAKVPSNKRPTALAAYNTARRKFLQRTPVAKPGTAKADWKKPGEIERFIRLWFKHGGDRVIVAYKMGITVGAVAMAYSRFIKHGATATYTPTKNLNRKPQESRNVSRPPMSPRTNPESVGARMAAA